MESNKQERANLLGINYLSKHMSTPLNMGGSKSGMYMNSPMEKELVGGQKNLPEALQKAIEASPAEMHGGPLHQKAKFKAGSDLTKAEIAKMKKESVFGPDGKKVAKPSNLGNKNASMGTDGKMTIISSKMQKNYKPIKKGKDKKPMETVKVAKKKKK
tara:strand:- start:485 stop:958 length:474 start_codon:yes stop_codon:yes gene_type:complete